jgi:hypothetical protein
MNEVQVKEIVREIVRESFKQSLSEETYQFGKKSYTDKKLTPSEILDLANAYITYPITKISGSSLGSRIYTANDLARLTGTIQQNVRIRSKQPALIMQPYKSGLITKDEYVELYTSLIKLQAKFITSYLNNASPENRNSSAAMRAAAKDGKDEFNFENVNEMGQNDVHFKNILRAYDHGGSFTKKKVAVAVCKNPNANRSKIIDYLKDMDYQEITQVEDELRIGESIDELKSVSGINGPNTYFKVKKKYNTFAEYEPHAKIGDTFLKYSKKSPSFNAMLQTGDLHQNAKKYLTKVHSIGTDGVNFTLFGKQTPSTIHPSDKKELAVVVLEGVVNEGKPNYEVYHKSYTSAIQSALDYAKKEGYDYDEEEVAREIGMGPRKPSEGKTNKFHINLTKNFKEQKKMLHIQVYGMKNSYELNAYIQ